MQKNYCKLINLNEVTLIEFNSKNEEEFNEILLKFQTIFKYGIKNRVVMTNNQVIDAAREVYKYNDFEIKKNINNISEIQELNLVYEDKIFKPIKINKEKYFNILDDLNNSKVINKVINHKAFRTKLVYLLYAITLLINCILAIINVPIIINVITLIFMIILVILSIIVYKFEPSKKRFDNYVDLKRNLMMDNYRTKYNAEPPVIKIKIGKKEIEL